MLTPSSHFRVRPHRVLTAGAAVLLLGASHELAPAVARWNVAHANRQMALIVLTPR